MPVQRFFAVLSLMFLAPFVASVVSAESTQDINLRFSPEVGQDAVQPGCTVFDYKANPCHQMATQMNGLDSPKIDVLILVPLSPFAERDMRIMRQSVEMWADGVKWMANDLGLPWLANGVEFHISAEMPTPIGPGGAEFTTYPIVDPEIVVIASNPVGGIGIGVDPLKLAGQIFGDGVGEGPCHGVKNPFDMALWSALPGYDSHHGGRGGTYVEDCGGAGGNICFSVNAAIDPDTATLDIFQLYDLVSHETGHCLTLGHVGDGAEGAWSGLPSNDIMAYSTDPPGISKCVSSLDVESLALSMSHYLDVNDDGTVDEKDHMHSNSVTGDGGRPFQIQHPDNHYYASPTRKAIDCPQPDLGLVPLNEVGNFTAFISLRPQLAITGRLDAQPVAQGRANFHGVTAGSNPASQVVLSAAAVPDLNGTHLGLAVTNVTVPIRADRTWSGNLDFASLADSQAVVVSARWLDATGALLDSDRVALLVDATAAVDGNAVAAADAGPGASGLAPGAGAGAPRSADAPGLVVALFAVTLVAITIARRKSP